MYRFYQTVFQIGGGSSLGTLMHQGDKLQVRQYFEEAFWDFVEFETPEEFCEFLEEKFFGDNRKVFYEEQPDSYDLLVKVTSPEKDSKLIGLIGVLKQ